MRGYIYILTFSALAISCKCRDNRGFISTSDTRTLFHYGFDTLQYQEMELKSRTNYRLNTRENDSIKVFRYVPLHDSLTGFVFQLRKNSGNLIWGPLEFEVVDSVDLLMDREKERFCTCRHVKPIQDVWSELYYNKEFGVLSFGNSGNKVVFLTTDDSARAKSLLQLVE